MPSQELIDYISKSIDKGVSREKIEENLLGVGWKKEQIDSAFSSLQNDVPAPEKEEVVPEVSPTKEETPVKNKKDLKKILLPVAVVAGLLIFGGIAFSFFRGAFSDPQKEIMQAFGNMKNLDALTTQVLLDVKAEGLNPGESFDGNILFTSRIDTQNEEVEAIIEGEGMAGGVGGRFKGRVFLVNDKIFGRLERFPDLGMFFPTPTEISEIMGKDILITDNVSEEITNGDVDMLLRNYFQMDPTSLFSEEVDEEIMEEFLEDVAKGLWRKEVLVVENTTKEEIAGDKVNRHEIKINLENMPDFLISIAEEYEDYIEDLDAEELKAEIEDGREEFEELVDDFEDINASIFIWTDGKYIHKIEILFSDDENIEMLSSLEVIFEVTFSDFDQPINLEEPEDYIDLEELMDPAYGGFDTITPPMTETRRSAYDTQIRSELAQIRSAAEQHYYDNGGSYEGFDSSERWFSISQHIPDCSIANLPENRPSAAEKYQIKIEDGGQFYTAWAPLCTEGFWCVDSEGSAERYENQPVDITATECGEVFGN